VTSYATGSGREAAADRPAPDELPAQSSEADASRARAEADGESAPGAGEQATTVARPAGDESPRP
jgi:hypothetical protein